MKMIKVISWVAAIGVASSLAIVMPALALVNVGVEGGVSAGGVAVGASAQGEMHGAANGTYHNPNMPLGVFGTVTAVNGNTITMETIAHTPRAVPMSGGSQGASTETKAISPSMIASLSYTVDATNAKIYKGSATTTVSVSSVAVGDSIMAQGTITGTNIVATVIRDGVEMMKGGPEQPVLPGRGVGHSGTSTPPVSPIKGNGEPVIGGTITAISSNTITVTNVSNITYSVNIASATLVKGGATIGIAGLATGDGVVVQGAVNGTSVTASSVLDQGVKGSADASSTGGASQGHDGGFGFGVGSFFGSIGGFFRHLFGF